MTQGDVQREARKKELRAFLLFWFAGVLVMFGIVFLALYAEPFLNWVFGKPERKAGAKPQRVIDTIPKEIPTPPPDERLRVRKGMRLWLRADAIERPDSSKLPYWADGSGTKHHAIQPMIPAQPMLIKKGIGEQPAVFFDGNNDYMHAGDVGPPDRFIPATVFIVWAKPDSGRDFWQRIFSTGSRGIDYQNNGANYVPNVVVQHGRAPAPPHITVMRYTAPRDFSNFHIGRINVPGIQQFYRGFIAEMIVYGRVLSQQEIQQVVRYLQQKYGIPPERTQVP